MRAKRRRATRSPTDVRLTVDQYKAIVNRTAKRADPEGELQTMCVAWFRSMRRFRKCQLVAIPNEGKRSHAVAAKLKRQGMHPGCYDTLLVRPTAQIVWIEFKAPGRLRERNQGRTDKQVEFGEWCDMLGIPNFVCDSFPRFEELCFSLVPENSA